MTTPPLLNWLWLSTLTLGTLWLFYQLLRRERCFQYNRLLLLLAAGLPLLHLPTPWLTTVAPAAPAPLRLLLPAVTVGASAAGAPAPTLATGLLLLYGSGVLLLLGRLGRQLWQLWRFARPLPAESRAGYTLRCTGGRRPTGSFGRTVFWDETAPLTAAEAAQVLAHELVHVRQHHTRDRLWLRLWQAVLWPNPFVHLLPRALDLIHEYLADAAVTANATPTDYVRLLARQATGWRGPAPTLAHTFFSSSTLTRIAMLNHPNVARRWKQWLALPVGAVLLFVVGCEKNTPADEAIAPQVKENKTPSTIEIRNVPGSNKMIVLFDNKPVGEGNNMDEVGEVLRKQLPSPPTLSDTPPPPPVVRKIERNAKGEIVYTYVEQMPEYPGGMGELMRYIGEHVHYPEAAKAEKLEGKVFINFIVAADGSIQAVNLQKGIQQKLTVRENGKPELQTTVAMPAAKAMNEEALRVVRELPRWTPGRQDGRPVAVSFTIPITYALR